MQCDTERNSDAFFFLKTKTAISSIINKASQPHKSQAEIPLLCLTPCDVFITHNGQVSYPLIPQKSITKEKEANDYLLLRES